MCTVRRLPPPEQVANSPVRMRAFGENANKWVVGTVITWSFMTTSDTQDDLDTPEQRKIVRDAWKKWQASRMNLTIKEVQDPNKALIRIAFVERGASWSYVGAQNRQIPRSQYTMNLGWDLNRQKGTAEHEIGHALGLDHEHQHPNSKLIWDEQAVLKEYMESQGWSEQEVRLQVINRVSQPWDGSNWDPTSIMHYPFHAKLIKGPAPFNQTGIGYNETINANDLRVMNSLYPAVSNRNRNANNNNNNNNNHTESVRANVAASNAPADAPEPRVQVLTPWQSTGPDFELGQDRVFVLQAIHSGQHTIEIVGYADVLLVVEATLKNGNSEIVHQIAAQQFAANGQTANRSLQVTLIQDANIKYVLKARLIFQPKKSQFTLVFTENH